MFLDIIAKFFSKNSLDKKTAEPKGTGMRPYPHSIKGLY